MDDPGSFPNFPEVFYVVDSTSSEIYRPKYNQDRYYSGKHKCHVMKAQTVHSSNGLCLNVCFEAGATHDKKIFDNSEIPALLGDFCILMDSGYQGVDMYLKGAIYPVKKAKH